jgi:iron complex transport system substrate-binding protein
MVLTESCVHVHQDRPVASMDLLFNDVLRLGQVMDVTGKAEALVNDWKEQLAVIEAKTSTAYRPRVFLLDGPADAPFTAGKFAIPDAMIAAAGGENVTHGMETSWGRTSWEAVAAANPECLVLLDYQTGNGAADTFRFLQEHPLMAHTDAVKNERWIGLRYEELTPGPANIGAIEKMVRARHPDRFYRGQISPHADGRGGLAGRPHPAVRALWHDRHSSGGGFCRNTLWTWLDRIGADPDGAHHL